MLVRLVTTPWAGGTGLVFRQGQGLIASLASEERFWYPPNLAS